MTVGGLCPGLNDVIQGLVRKLRDYGVPEGSTFGIRCVWLEEGGLVCLRRRRCDGELGLDSKHRSWD